MAKLSKEELERRASNIGVDLSNPENINDLAIKLRQARTMKIPKTNYRNELAESNSTIKDPYNKQLMNHLLLFRELPKPKSDEELIERIDSYFEYCAHNELRPTIEALALSCGVSTRELLRWENGEGVGESDKCRITKSAKQIVSAFDAQAVIEGKMNTVAYIFRSKNHYGMKDQTEQVITHNNSDKPMSEAEIKAKLESDVIDIDFEEV